MIKLVNKITEEIYNIKSVNIDTETCNIEYQANNWAIKQNLELPARDFFVHENIFADYEGYEFKNWTNPDWPHRINVNDSQIKQIVSNEQTKIWYDNLFVEPKNPYYTTDSGAIIYLNVIEPEAQALLDSMGIIVENYEQS